MLVALSCCLRRFRRRTLVGSSGVWRNLGCHRSRSVSGIDALAGEHEGVGNVTDERRNNHWEQENASDFRRALRLEQMSPLAFCGLCRVTRVQRIRAPEM